MELRNNKENQRRNDDGNVEVSGTNAKANAVHAEACIAVRVSVFDVSDFHWTNLLLKMEYIKGLNTTSRDALLLEVTTLRV